MEHLEQLLSIIRTNTQSILPEEPKEFYTNCTWPLVDQVLTQSRFKNLKGLGLDIYGTLVVSAAGDISLGEEPKDSHGAMNQLMIRWNLPYEPDQLVQRIDQEISQEHKRARFAGILYPEVDIRACWHQMFFHDLHTGNLSLKVFEHLLTPGTLELFATDYETVVNPVAPMPALTLLLETLSQQTKLVTGIVSNAQSYTPYLFPGFTGRTLEEFGFEPALQIYSYQHGKGKPSVELYQLLAQAYRNRGISPEQVLFLGNDLLKDCWAASQTGFLTGLYAGDKRSLRLHEGDQRLTGFDPDVVLKDLVELVKLISLVQMS
jgi:putative hydrolase of the HAD superfamily